MDKQAYEHMVGLTLSKHAGWMDDKIAEIKEKLRQDQHKAIDSNDPGLGPIGNWHIRNRAHNTVDKVHSGTYTNEDFKDDAYHFSNVGSERLAEGSLKRELIERAPVYGASMLAGGTIGSTIAGEGNRLAGFGVGSATAALLTLLGRKLYYGKSISW